jgi:hypothetical protein
VAHNERVNGGLILNQQLITVLKGKRIYGDTAPDRDQVGRRGEVFAYAGASAREWTREGRPTNWLGDFVVAVPRPWAASIPMIGVPPFDPREINQKRRSVGERSEFCLMFKSNSARRRLSDVYGNYQRRRRSH